MRWRLPCDDADFGDLYVLVPDTVPAIRQLRAELIRVRSIDRRKTPANVDLALRSFMATYDRWPKERDTAVLDCFAALEALLGMRDEITFRLALRVAGMLAASDAERVAIFNEMRAWYGVRSTLIHGGVLKPAQLERLATVDDLRDVVRRVLRGFIRITVEEEDGSYDRKLFEQHLDETLLDGCRREALRRSMGFG
jgi:hypothetical protein